MLLPSLCVNLRLKREVFFLNKQLFFLMICVIYDMMLEQIQKCFQLEKVLYTKHAKDEMEIEEFGEILEYEVCEVVLTGKVIENYPGDEPYPSCLIYGKTNVDRPVHVVCAYSEDDEITIIITVYQPDPDRWIDFERRKE